MKSVWSMVMVGFFLFSLSACKVVKSEEMTVVRDCTGTYLRSEGKDYHVCNLEKAAAFSDGSKVTVSFQKTEKCSAADSLIVCMMYHENEGWIKVRSIK